MGAWMLVIVALGSVLFVASAIAEGTWGVLFLLVVWSLPLGLYGVRIMRMAVVADMAGLVVHNRFRSRALGWSEIASISFEKRRGPWWYPVVMIWDRWIGVVRLVDGREVEVEATETFWANWSGRLFTGSKREAEKRTERLSDLWARFRT